MISESVHKLESDSSFVQNSIINRVELAQSIHVMPEGGYGRVMQMGLLLVSTDSHGGGVKSLVLPQISTRKSFKPSDFCISSIPA